MHQYPHVGDREFQQLGNFTSRESLDVAKRYDGLLGLGKFSNRRSDRLDHLGVVEAPFDELGEGGRRFFPRAPGVKARLCDGIDRVEVDGSMFAHPDFFGAIHGDS